MIATVSFREGWDARDEEEGRRSPPERDPGRPVGRVFDERRGFRDERFRPMKKTTSPARLGEKKENPPKPASSGRPRVTRESSRSASSGLPRRGASRARAATSRARALARARPSRVTRRAPMPRALRGVATPAAPQTRSSWRAPPGPPPRLFFPRLALAVAGARRRVEQRWPVRRRRVERVLRRAPSPPLPRRVRVPELLPRPRAKTTRVAPARRDGGRRTTPTPTTTRPPRRPRRARRRAAPRLLLRRRRRRRSRNDGGRRPRPLRRPRRRRRPAPRRRRRGRRRRRRRRRLRRRLGRRLAPGDASDGRVAAPVRRGGRAVARARGAKGRRGGCGRRRHG